MSCIWRAIRRGADDDHEGRAVSSCWASSGKNDCLKPHTYHSDIEAAASCALRSCVVIAKDIITCSCERECRVRSTFHDPYLISLSFRCSTLPQTPLIVLRPLCFYLLSSCHLFLFHTTLCAERRGEDAVLAATAQQAQRSRHRVTSSGDVTYWIRSRCLLASE